MSAATDSPPGPFYTVTSTVDDYREAVRRLASGTGPVAVDTERASGFRYRQRAYLVQLFREGAGVVLIDPIPLVESLGSMNELFEAIENEEWVLHAATQDLPCLREIGLNPSRIFDTELGARLLGFEKVGLGSLVEALLGIHLAKAHSAADWSTRPLPQGWLEYAALDVELLVNLRNAVERLLVEAGKAELAAQEFAGVLTRDLSHERAEPWRRLHGIHAIKSPRGLAIARELWLARDAYARETDIAPGRLVPDASLVAAAIEAPRTRKRLADMKDFQGRASRTQLERWFAAIEVGRDAPVPPRKDRGDDALPAIRAWKDRKPEADGRLNRARTRLQAEAEARQIPMENLLTPELLRQLAWQPPEQQSGESLSDAVARSLASAGARAWQCELCAPLIAESFTEVGES